MLTACNFNIFTQQTLILPELIEKLPFVIFSFHAKNSKGVRYKLSLPYNATSTGRPLGSEWFIKRLEETLGRDILPQKGGTAQKKTRKKS
jgi:hypothetical protein